MRAIARKKLEPTGGLFKNGLNLYGVSLCYSKMALFIWGFPVTKIMLMVKLCVEWLRELLAYLNSQVNILSIFGLSKFLFRR